MALKDELQACSYKGFRFLYRSITTRGGQKIAMHEFPGSNNRNVEDLGQFPDIFTVDGIVHGLESVRTGGALVARGLNYIRDVRRFKQILSEGGEGDFVHPTQGTFKVKALTYTLVESDNELGAAKFQITFAVSTKQIQPIPKKSNVAKVSQGTEAVNRALASEIANNYKVSSEFQGNFIDAVEQINLVNTEFVQNSRQFIQNLPGVAEFVQGVQDFKRDTFTLAKVPENLATSVFGLFDLFNGIQSSAVTGVLELISFFDFGDDDVPNKNNTASLIQRTNNRNILRLAIQAGALAESYREASLINFQTVEEIDATQEILDIQYQKVNNAIDNESKKQLTALRVQVNKLFIDQRLTAAQIIELNLPRLPAIVQAQNLYGDRAQEFVDRLISINNTTDTSHIGGQNTKVLTA